MNLKKLIQTLGFSCLLTAGLQAATVIEYRFDSQTRPNGTYSYFSDSSGNGYDLKFNSLIAQQTGSTPFAAWYPPSSTTNQNARNNTSNDIRAGTVQGGSGISNWQTGNSFTLEGWVQVSSIVTSGGTPQSGVLWALTAGGGGDPSRFQLRYNADLTVSAWWFSQGVSAYNTTITSTGKIVLNEWTHLAYVYNRADNGTLSLYINGELAASASGLNVNLPATLSGTFNAAMNIGGNFDDFRLSNTALSVEELGYRAPFTPVPEPSTAVILMLGIGGAAATLRKRAGMAIG